MRKALFAVLALMFVSGGLLAADAPKKRAFSLNAGAQMMIWSDVEVGQIVLDFRAGFRLGRSFEIAPELALWTAGDSGHSPSDKTRLVLGVMANFVTRHFFAGAGVVFPGGIGAKANIGVIIGRHIMITTYVASATVSGNEGSSLIFGLTGGYRF